MTSSNCNALMPPCRYLFFLFSFFLVKKIYVWDVHTLDVDRWHAATATRWCRPAGIFLFSFFLSSTAHLSMYLSICLSLWDGTYIHTPWVWMDDVQQLHRANAALQVSLCVCGWRQHLYVSVCICLYLYLSLSVSVFVSVSMAYMYLDYRWMTSSNCNALMPPCRYLFSFFFFFFW